jgi:arginase
VRTSRIAVLDAPSDLGLKQTGVDGLPYALRSAGLLEGVPDVEYTGAVAVPAFSSERDERTGVRNLNAIRAFSLALADRVGSCLDSGRFPLVLGGDCSILIGSALALRRRGRFGLLFIDGHADFYSPDAEPNGEAASMDLALVTGRGPDALTDLDGLRPLVREENVVLFGARDRETAARYGSPDVRASGIHVLELADVQHAGARAAARDAVAVLEAQELQGFWIHLDADVLDDEVMPAVDYRTPGGLSPEELTEVLTAALASKLAVGMQVTIYNPALDDAERSAGRTLAGVATRSFAAARRGSFSL